MSSGGLSLWRGYIIGAMTAVETREGKEHPRVADKRRRQELFFDAMQRGIPELEALVIAETSWSTLRNQWKPDADFKQRLHQARKAQALASERGFMDFLAFRERHFAYVDRRDRRVKKAQNSWFQIDANAHLEENKRAVIVLPPGHIKTTFFSIERSVYDIMRDRNFRITVLQKNGEEASKLIAAVQERLECDYYHELMERLEAQGEPNITCPVCIYGSPVPFKPLTAKSSGEKWGAYGFKVLGRTGGEKDLTMEAKGVGGAVQGIRADRIVGDDIQDPMAPTRSVKDSADLLDWTQKVILGRIYDDQQFVLLTNFFSPDDYAHKLIEAMPDWPVINYPAIRDHDKRVVLCPEVWSYQGLMAKRKEVGESVWHYTWMQGEGTFDDQTFKREVLEESRDEQYHLGEVPYAVTHVFVGCDPATAVSGYCAMVVWGLDVRTKQRYLIDIFNQKGMRNWGNVIKQLVAFTETYLPRVVVVEKNNTQGGFINEDSLMRGIRSAGARLQPYQTVTGTGARAESTNFDITTIGGLFDGGLITLPYGGSTEGREKVDRYIDQLVAWRTDSNGNSIKHLVRDMVMATLFAESEAFTIAQRGPTERKERVSRVPGWAQNAAGGFRWQRGAKVQRDPDESREDRILRRAKERV